MYVGNRYSANVEKLVPLDFACSECDYEQVALVPSWGEGQGNSPYFLDETGAKDRAAVGADGAADKNARKILALACCPQCFAQDQNALRRHRINTWLTLLALFVVCGLLGALLAVLLGPTWGYGIMIVSGSFGLFGVWGMDRRIELGAADVVFPNADGAYGPDDNEAFGMFLDWANGELHSEHLRLDPNRS